MGLVATGVVVMLSGSDSGKDGSAVDVRKAGLAFGTDPAAKTDGRDQELNAVAASGDTVVTAGGDADHTGYQARFMVSADGGRTFRTAPVRTSDGEEPVLGEAPRQMAVSPKGWLAIGDRPGGNVVWTSKDGREWIRRPDMASATFGTRDRISRLIGTQQGFLAVGATSASGDFKDAAPALWISGDGQSWQRLTGDRLSLVSGRGTLWLTNAAATGGTMLIQGVYTPKSSGKSPRNLLWRSADGGRTWKEVTVPSPRGTGGLNIGPMPNGFIAVREINPKSNAYGAVFTSPDGTQWTRTGSITAPGYERVWRLSASPQGVTAAVQATGKVVLDSSQDAATWRLSGEVAAPGSRTLLDTTTVANGNVLVGRDQSQDVNAVLTVRDAQGQDVQAALPAAQPDDMVQAVAASGGRAVAVGSANGHAAVWNSPDGGTHWNRSDVGTLVRSGRQRLLDVTSGSAGWLAVGVDTAAPWRSIVAASADGTTWQPADRVSAFKPESGTTLVTYGAASGPGGYVIVGEEGLAPATWFSSDLKSWTRGTGETRDDLSGRQGANRWMRGVVSGSFGYVAVGGQLDPSIQNAPAVRPAVWTSADGRTWADHQLPVPSGALQGSFVSVAVKGGVLVAAGGADTQTGLAPFAFVSTDGGRSWQEAKVPVTGGQPVPTTVSKVVATPKGFAMAGVAGHPANGDVVLWTSKDGRTWTPAENLPSGLGGRGNQELAGLATVGGDLLAVGSTRDSQGSQPLLWKTPAP